LSVAACLAEQLRYSLRRDRHFEDADTERRQCIGNRVENSRRCADRSALADTLGAGNARFGKRFQMMDFDVRDFGCGRHGIVGKRGGQYVAAIVINHLFIERVGDALGDTAMDLPLDYHRVDQAASVFDDYEPLDLHLAGRDIDFDDRDMAGV